MKKNILFIIGIFTFILLPTKTLAVSGNINLSCTPTSALPGDTITCTIAADVSDGSVDSFAATVSLSDNLTFGTSSVSSDWSGTSTNGIFSLEADTAQSDSFEIASFTVIVSEDSTSSATITVTPTKLGDISSLSAASQTIAMTSQESTTTTTEETTITTEEENPDTGTNIPFMILGSGLILLVVLYQIGTKSKKLHKI